MSKRKKIIVNARFLIKDKLEGIGYFTLETLRHITTQHLEIDFVFLFDRAYDPAFIFSKNIQAVVLMPPARHPFLWHIWFQFSVKNYLKKNPADLFLSPDGFLPLKTDVPSVAVQHDLAFIHYPQFVSRLTCIFYNHFVPKFSKQATQIATVSEYSKADLVQHYSIPLEKISVVYSASKSFFHPISDEQQTTIRQTFAHGKRYFIYVGSVHPRKNILNMLRAFELFHQQLKSDYCFLIAGAKGWKNEELEQFYQNMREKEKVIFTGRLNEDELNSLIASAEALLYVSLFEGFGVPPLEAMQCHVPVIAGNVSSMPEICGEAALFAHPENPTEIANQMVKLSTDINLRTTLIKKGQEQLQKFSWQKTADLLWQCCEKAMR